MGEQTLKDLVAEAAATEARRKAQVRTVLTSSYSHHYRQMLPRLLEALQFRCNNTAYRPVMDAVELLHRYSGGLLGVRAVRRVSGLSRLTR